MMRRSSRRVVVSPLWCRAPRGAVMSEAVLHASIDPTEQAFAVTLHNNTPSACPPTERVSGTDPRRP